MKGETRNARRRKPEPRVIDLMAALEASLRESRESTGKRRARERATSRGRAAAGGRRTAARRTRRSAA
ncbi:MAG TPA: hypothetical protein VGJ87_18660, partial [Roseiflexaceae bacterium]